MLITKWYKRPTEVKTEVTCHTSAQGSGQGIQDSRCTLHLRDPEMEKWLRIEMTPEEAKQLGESLIHMAKRSIELAKD